MVTLYHRIVAHTVDALHVWNFSRSANQRQSHEGIFAPPTVPKSHAAGHFRFRLRADLALAGSRFDSLHDSILPVDVTLLARNLGPVRSLHLSTSRLSVELGRVRSRRSNDIWLLLASRSCNRAAFTATRAHLSRSNGRDQRRRSR